MKIVSLAAGFLAVAIATCQTALAVPELSADDFGRLAEIFHDSFRNLPRQPRLTQLDRSLFRPETEYNRRHFAELQRFRQSLVPYIFDHNRETGTMITMDRIHSGDISPNVRSQGAYRNHIYRIWQLTYLPQAYPHVRQFNYRILSYAEVDPNLPKTMFEAVTNQISLEQEFPQAIFLPRTPAGSSRGGVDG